MLAAHPDGRVAVAQLAHAWLSGQLARAWGNERFASPEPWEEVCLAAEQHDTGMAEWDQAPELDPRTGLPLTFRDMPLATHLRLWTQGPQRLTAQSRYAALLTSLHGSALYGNRREDPQVDAFLARRRAFEERLRASLEVPDAQVARNQRLLWTWDGMSLALILEWAPWSAERVPTAGTGEPTDLTLRRVDDGHKVQPWPFTAQRLTVRTEGRLLRGTFADEDALHAELARAPWVELAYELRAPAAGD